MPLFQLFFIGLFIMICCRIFSENKDYYLL